ncbi:hypothetical protein FRX31_020456 [Thalictrum thalictroides]|uniref:Uncharacterized protein n=1 Tax=Thalictrum thalictroides TaxID=46969 RepID=A0A7J6VZ40_THATH|nr:hypothetical protein FRX31_020456 [Thalictrum thalictroides]
MDASYSVMINELQDRQSRDKNVIFFNVPESNNDADDISAVNDVLSKIGASVATSQIVRLGKTGPKPRPIKIICNAKSDVGLILKSKNKLRNIPGLNNVHITADWTSSQRSFYNCLRGQLSTRKNNGETNLYIGYVKGVPTILQKN